MNKGRWLSGDISGLRGRDYITPVVTAQLRAIKWEGGCYETWKNGEEELQLEIIYLIIRYLVSSIDVSCRRLLGSKKQSELRWVTWRRLRSEPDCSNAPESPRPCWTCWSRITRTILLSDSKLGHGITSQLSALCHGAALTASAQVEVCTVLTSPETRGCTVRCTQHLYTSITQGWAMQRFLSTSDHI